MYLWLTAVSRLILIRLFRFDLRQKFCIDHCLTRLGHQFPEWFSVETGEREGNTAGLPQRDDPPPVEVEQLVQFHQIAGYGDER